MKRWARKHDKCGRCDTTERPHDARGYCKKCYNALFNAECRKRYQANHPERVREQKRKQYNPEKNKLRTSRWRANNLEKARASDRTRKQRQREICLETPELAKNRALLLSEIGHCMNCESTDRLEIHHIVSRTVCFDHSLENLKLLCHRCHRITHGCTFIDGEYLNDQVSVGHC